MSATGDNYLPGESGDMHDVGLGGTTGGGMLGGGTPNDIAEGRSAFHVDPPEEEAEDSVDGSGEFVTTGATGGDSSDLKPDPVDIPSNPADSTGTTDAGLTAGGGTTGGTGGLVSGGLPEELEGDG